MAKSAVNPKRIAQQTLGYPVFKATQERRASSKENPTRKDAVPLLPDKRAGTLKVSSVRPRIPGKILTICRRRSSKPLFAKSLGVSPGKGILGTPDRRSAGANAIPVRWSASGHLCRRPKYPFLLTVLPCKPILLGRDEKTLADRPILARG